MNLFQGQDMSVFDLPTVQPQETIYYGQNKQNDCADVYYSPKGDKNTLVMILHGGYWNPNINRKHIRPFAAAIAQIGFDTLNVEYCRINSDPDIQIKDSIQAVKLLPSQLKKKYQKIVLIGHSVGGYLTYHLQLALKRPQMKFILLAPVLNLQRTENLQALRDLVIKYIGGPASSRKDLDPFLLDTYPEGQITIIQGLKDTRVPASFTQEFIQKYNRKKPKNTIINYKQIPDIGHFELINPKSQKIFNLIVNSIQNS